MENLETFKPDSLNIRDIFCNGNVAYKVPDYQRRYSWKKEQLDALWGDLYESYQNDHQACYFLGSIVVVKNANNVFELIDGQQRLTTLMIMISVLFKTYPYLSCPNPDNPDDESSLIDAEILEECLFFRKGKRRLTLQTAVEYDSDFNSIIIDNQSFSTFSYPTKAEMKKDNPVFNFKYTAKFFFDKFQELAEGDREKFVFYVFNNVKLIRIVCNTLPFAIKLFQVMNDRGMPLAASDIIKSYIMGRIENEGGIDKEDLSRVFTSNWKEIETIINKHDLKMDDFMVFYEYFKLKSNPKRQVVDELKAIIENKDIEIKEIVDELKAFSNSLDNILSSTDPTIYSLFYIPWPTYVKTCLASAYQVKYGIKIVEDDKGDHEDDSEQKELISLMRRYFYLAYVSGKTLNQIKQTSFNLLAAIVDQKPLDDIKKILNDSISKYKMIKGVYEALKDEVYGEDYLKPLFLSIEYANREVTNTTFVPINKELHMDHILPQAFAKDKDWDYINSEEVSKYMNTLGNMALLHYKKNEEALNRGFKIKCNIYQGKNEDGTPNNSGTTSFDTTREVTDVYEKDGRLWDIEDIKRRYETQMGRIESLLGISEDMIENDSIMSDSTQTPAKKASRFNFAELGIAPGSVLSWYNDPSITCTVIDEHNVIHNGEQTTLSRIATNKNGSNSNGALYFVYEGKTISQIRDEKEKASQQE
jgi:uncharacterized protein with ParB-like and HNH nuclease domain